MLDAKTIIKELELVPLPGEGGFYKETFSSTIMIPKETLGSTYPAARAISSAIYYLITLESYSTMHRLRGTEIFHLYLGGPVETTLLYKDGTGEIITIGCDIENGMRPQIIIPEGTWQGSELAEGSDFDFALLGTTMAPGFSIDDFELGKKSELKKKFPDFSEEITRLTR
ncbi:MAG: cupin domain-containing protein [Thermodesulfobacteriota bacterium]